MRRRVALGLTAAFIVASGLTGPASAAGASSCGPGGSVQDAGNGWLASRPTFPAGRARVSLLAAPAFDPNLIYATNGTVLMRSVDAGCSWLSVLTAAPTGPVATAPATITALTAPTSANSSSYVYVGVTTSVAGVELPAVLTSPDRGAHWTTADSNAGLPVSGSVRELVGQPQTPDTAYVVIAVTVGAAVSRAAIYATTDAGVSWGSRTGTTESFDGAMLTIDPTRQTALFAIDGTRQIVSSIDGGISFTRTSGAPGGPVGSLSLAPGGGSIRLAAGRSDASAVERSDDGGRSWRSAATPQTPVSVAAAPLQNLTAVSDGRQLGLLAANGVYRAAGPSGDGAPVGLVVSAPTTSGFALTGLEDGAVLRASFGTSGKVLPPVRQPGGGLRPISLMPGGPVRQFPSTLLPSGLRVALPAGGRRLVPLQLLVPRTPTPVDVMFLIDTTSSMQPVIDELRQNISRLVMVLDTAGLNARFGIADFRDYPSPAGSAQASDWPYRLRRRIGRVNEELRAAIGQLSAAGGTTDGGASALTALLQSTTGEGDTFDGVHYVARGEDARYRPDALRLAMLATDTTPHYGGQQVKNDSGNTVTNPGPGYDQVIAALLRKSVHSVGLALGSDAVPAMTRLARGSKTFAPRGGVDCDGNGTVDVPAAAPLVCSIASGGSVSVSTNANGTKAGTGGNGTGGVSGAVVGLANGIADVRPVVMRVRTGTRFARVVGTPAYPVDLRQNNELAYRVELSCPLAAASRQPIELRASVGRRELARTELTLDCGGVATAAGTVAVPPVRAAAEAPPPAPPAAQPVPNPNPNPNPNVNPAANVNVNVNAGLVEQSEPEQQLAMAEDGGGAESESYAMSAVGHPGRSEEAFVLVAGVLLAAATSVAVRTRTSLVCGFAVNPCKASDGAGTRRTAAP